MAIGMAPAQQPLARNQQTPDHGCHSQGLSMAKNKEPAAPRSLSAEATTSLLLMNEFYEAVERFFIEIFGKGYRSNPRRHRIMRALLKDNALGEPHTVSYYMKSLSKPRHNDNPETIRLEVHALELDGYVFLSRGRHSTIAYPTVELINLYNDRLPKLLAASIIKIIESGAIEMFRAVK